MSDLWEDCLEKSEEKTVFGTTGGPGNCWPEANTVFCRCALSGKSVYFHCAPEGYKLECVRANNRACFCVVGHTRIIPEGFTTEYRSVMAFGTVACSLPESERLSALDLLVDKYSADFKDIAAKYIAGSFHRTEILRLDIEHLSGKHKELHK